MIKSFELETFGLESIESQTAVLDQSPDAQHIQNLRGILKNYSAYIRKLKRLQKAYNRQDIRHLYRSHSLSGAKNKMLFVYERNRQMTLDILRESQQADTFFAVGAGHLWGKVGILAELKRAGMKPKPIRIV